MKRIVIAGFMAVLLFGGAGALAASDATAGPSSTCFSCIIIGSMAYCDEYQNGDQYGPYETCGETVSPCAENPEIGCNSCTMTGPGCSAEAALALANAIGADGHHVAFHYEGTSSGVRDPASRGCSGVLLVSGDDVDEDVVAALASISF
jgi:hypothetical protein